MSRNKNYILKERKQRVDLLLRELEYEILDTEDSNDSYSATFQDSEECVMGYYVEKENKFVEFSFIFCFSADFQDYIRDRMEELLQICCEFGVYFNLVHSTSEILFSIFTKTYYAGLNYHALKYSLSDLKKAARTLTKLLDVRTEIENN